MLDTFFGFVAVVVFLPAVVFLEESLGVAVFLAVGFEDTFPLGFLDAGVFLDLSATALEVAFLEISMAGFFTALATAFFGFSLVEDGFFVVVVPLLVDTGFLF